MTTELSHVEIRIPGLTERQKAMLAHKARILHIGTGTKTGKTFAFTCWISQGIVAGERCCWVAPWYPRARAAFEIIRSILSPLIDSGELQATDTLLRIRNTNGGGLDVFSGDNFQSVYGGNYSRVVVDEASRCPSGVWPAVLTTISATNGRARTAFNLELGSKNWAIRNLLRVQAMTPEERKAASEDFLLFPTGGDGLVDPSLIELLRAQMPAPLWRALYLAEIPSEDVALFRNLDRIFCGMVLDEPADGHNYVCGIDLGRKQDYTVVTVVDSETGAVVAGDRFHQMSWSLQCSRCAELYRRFGCQRAWVDATGIGDPVTEELVKLGLIVEPFVFTVPSRKALLETLILACDNCQITLPVAETFSLWRQELEAFEYVLDGSTVKYAAPAGFHDDTVMSLALAVFGFKSGALGGLFQLWKQQAEELKGQSKPSDPEGQFQHQAQAAMTQAKACDARVARVFGAQVHTQSKPVPSKSKPRLTAKCPNCGNSGLSRCGVTGPSGDVAETCPCGWSTVLQAV